ncbi:hypothetical protein H6G00_01310 [Leptolyngbya sp. FACHB-541]|uniref:hypothetical protein n=1 Tax=Leptolyngbya sp. FACHB-541 TaxID=2692810 RepID=UPI001688E892|nr:hypothetical protein [Leptolyngbya sp. FACHB-541]MBD1995268.1 hypothetical protein [Leptolyngbya sp. FACHB-541]
MQVIPFPTRPKTDPPTSGALPERSKQAENQGLAGIALLLSIKQLAQTETGSFLHRLAITRVSKELRIISEFSDPDMRRIIRLTISFLSSEEWEALKAIQGKLEMPLLGGDDDELIAA